MAVSPIAVPKTMKGPGFLFLAPALSAIPTHASAGGKFTDVITTPWIALGATQEGSEFAYETTIEPTEVAEFIDPIEYDTVSRAGRFTFNLANYTLSNYRRALNGGVAALVPSGTAGAEVTEFSPPTPGTETRCMLLWESLDSSMRLVAEQCIQGGEVTSTFAKAPAFATIPCTFNFEIPPSGKPFRLLAAGTARV